MKLLPTLSALLLSLYIHGLTLYFSVSSLAGIHTSILTAIFQIASLILPFLLCLSNEESRKKLFRLEIIELLYVGFILIFLYDLFTSKLSDAFPNNLAIYFGVYWFSLSLTRSITFKQFKLICYATCCLTVITSLLLLGQVATGTASWADHGRRLVAGSAGNPIITGYTGAYAFVTSLILWMRAKPSMKLVWLAASIPGLSVCIFSGTRSAIVSLIVGGGFVIVYTLNILFQSNRSSSKFLSNTVVVFAVLLSASLLLTPFTATSSTKNSLDKPSPITAAIDNGTKRIDALFRLVSGGESGDGSIEGRRTMYESTWESFTKNPIWGNGLYSSDTAHNAFLQVATEFGLLGVLTFVVPFIYLAYRMFKVVVGTSAKFKANSFVYVERYLKSDYSMITSFAIVIFVQATCLFSFHGDPYRNYLPICSIGILIAFIRLGSNAVKSSSR